MCNREGMVNVGNGGNLISSNGNDIPYEEERGVVLKESNSPEVLSLSNSIVLSDTDSVLSFGKEAASEISKFTDQILSSTSKTELNDSGVLLKNLAVIMKTFDPKDFEVDDKPGFLDKLLKRVSNKFENIMDKYRTMDLEVQNIFSAVKEYEKDITNSNITLDTMYSKNQEYYLELDAHIQAGFLIKDRITSEWLPDLESKSETGDAIDHQNYLGGLDFLEVVDQRIQDLEMAKMVSIQIAPQIKMIQRGNYNLLRKINSAFVITLPVFKIGLTQAIIMRQQNQQIDSLKALDDQTNIMLINNANNIKQSSINISKLSGGSSIKMETLEETYSTIMEGIEETLQIESENKQKREVDRIKLQELQDKLLEVGF